MHLEACFEWRVHSEKIREKITLNVRVKSIKNKVKWVKIIRTGIIDRELTITLDWQRF
jgi:hypothetical protein